MKHHTTLALLALLTACGGGGKRTPEATPAASQPTPVSMHSGTPQIPPVELGRRPPNTPMTHANMPFFDTVTYCEAATKGRDKIRKGPHYESCVEDQEATRIVLADAIDASKFAEPDIIRCAKDSRTAYEGMWFCLNGQAY